MKRYVLMAAAVVVGFMAMAGAAVAQNKVKQDPGHVQVCGGPDGGNYNKVAHDYVTQLNQLGVPAQAVLTQGSVQNLSLIVNPRGGDAPWCDVTITQNDALRNFMSANSSAAAKIERVENLYTEKVHVLCNRDYVAKHGIGRFPDLRGKKDLTIAVGTAGSGNNETWLSQVAADPEYGKLKTTYLTNVRAIQAVSAGEKAQCMIYTAGFNTEFMKDVAQNYGKTVKLIGFNDGDIDNVKDEKGRPIYTLTSIPGGDYRNLQDSGITCLGSCAVKTAKVAAVLITVSDFDERFGDKGYRALVKANNNLKNSIKAKYDPE